jgi:hypothetical protein
MVWKFARESAFAAGTANNIEIFLRRMSDQLSSRLADRSRRRRRNFGQDVVTVGLAR